jgi:ABC-type glycerol-3-phosphate transport system substrate-binding protein
MILSYPQRFTQSLILLLAGITIWSLSACQTTSAITELTSGLSTVETTSTIAPVKTPVVTTTLAITVTVTPTDETMILTFWTVEAFSPEAEGDLGLFFSNSLRAFERNNPDTQVRLLLKKASGKGGMLDFLRTSRQAAPTILPDVAIMKATDLPNAYADGLLQILGDRLDRPIVQDLLPAARRMGTVNERLVGVPIGLDMEHTIYNTRTFTTTPLLWADVLTGHKRYLFPAKGVNGLINDATLSQYFSAGGAFHLGQRSAKLDEPVLRDVLSLYLQALENKVIDATLLEASSPEELWPAYMAGRANLAQVSVRQFLTNREKLVDTNFAALPIQTSKDTPVAITHGYALVLITDDINRQRAALRLMEWFLSTSNNATWNSLNKSIPTRDTAFQQVAGNDPYWAFLQELLKTAQPEPGFIGYDQFGRIIQQAVEQVIRGEATPQEAAATAMDALNP